MSLSHTKTPSSRFFYFALLTLLALLPFHAFGTTWASTVFDNRALLQSWKEIVILGLCLYTLFWTIRDRALGKFLLENPLNKLILLYAALHLTISLILRPELLANLHGLKINLEFLALFICAQAIVWRARPSHADRTIADIIIIGGVVVALFGLAQALLLPKDFLLSFGYGPGTINPYLPIGEDSQLFRVISSLGGPNQLGQYLILPLACVLYKSFRTKNYSWLGLSLPILGCMYFTYSRSAWVGAALALVVIGVYCFGWRKMSAAVGIGLLALAAISVIYVNKVQKGSSLSYVIFHGSSPTDSISNNDHIKAIASASRQVISQPFGNGTGTAGPASYYLKAEKGSISENYYLQVALEVGVMGLLLFVVIVVATGLALMRIPASNNLAIPLLSALVGWSFINLLLHGWADSTASLVWWGSAGAIIRKSK